MSFQTRNEQFFAIFLSICRVLKNVQMQGASFDKLRINSPEE